MISGLTIYPDIYLNGVVIFGFLLIYQDLFRVPNGCNFLQGQQNLIKSLAFRTSELSDLDLFRHLVPQY